MHGRIKKPYIWRFPETIKLFEVPEYLQLFIKIRKHKEIVFDMRNTLDVNSSFIGFLIYCKENLRKQGGKYVFLMSPNVEKVFSMLKMNEYFAA